MDREILFRGKRIDNGEWAEGDLAQHKDGRKHIRCWYMETYVSYEVDPETVCQYTGLIDKNGRKIFEGDIVKKFFSDGTEWKVSEIIYLDSPLGAGWKTSDIKTLVDFDRSLSCTGLGSRDSKDIEVIGNIYDNPELLEGGAE